MDGQFTRVDETPFSLIVPGNGKLEPYDDGKVEPPLMKCSNDNDSSNDEGNYLRMETDRS